MKSPYFYSYTASGKKVHIYLRTDHGRALCGVGQAYMFWSTFTDPEEICKRCIREKEKHENRKP